MGPRSAARFSDAAKDRKIFEDANAYSMDAARRYFLTLDTLRERGNNDIEHEAAGTPPVLDYKTEVVVDGRTLPIRSTTCFSGSSRRKGSRFTTGSAPI